MSDLISYGFLTPPAVLILLSLVGALLALRWRGFGLALVMLSSTALYLLAMPVVASYLLQQVEAGIPDRADLSRAQAIVVLAEECLEIFRRLRCPPSRLAHDRSRRLRCVAKLLRLDADAVQAFVRWIVSRLADLTT